MFTTIYFDDINHSKRSQVMLLINYLKALLNKGIN